MGKRIVSKGGGIGTSRVNRDPAAVEVDYLEPLRGLHFNGVPAEEVPEISWRFLKPEGSDEYAAANPPEPRIELHERGADPRSRRVRSQASDVDRGLAERGDFLMENEESFMAPDVRLDLAQAYVEPGMRARFVAEKKLSRDGRDARGWEVVKDAKGEPVRHGSSVLAQMPDRKARQRNDHYRKQGNDLLDEVYKRADNGKGGVNYLTPDELLETSTSR